MGLHDFIICLGYKGYVIKEYFANYFLHMSNVTFDMRDNSMTVHQASAEPWRVTLIDTGDETMIGGRIKRILPFVEDDKAFCLTYGDGVGDIDISSLIDLHHREGVLATVTAT
jgi:glucose-1-phosphate cytidylyltransferase